MSYLKVRSCLVILMSLLFAELAIAKSEFTSQDFIDVSSIRTISEIETAKIALEKSSSLAIKTYAERIIEEQTGALKELRELAESQHLRMASNAELQAKARVFVFQRNGRAFDAAYAEMRVIERRKSVNLFRDIARTANGDVRQYATQQLPILMRHLYMAQTLVGDLERGAALLADNSGHL